MVHFTGAGPGAKDLITLRALRLIENADVIIYAGSLVNAEILEYAKKDCRIYNSALMTLEEIIQTIEQAENEGLDTVRLHTGDPSIYGAIGEQMAELDKRGIKYDICPGVSSFCGAAASLGVEYTLPDISQSVIICREEGRTPLPEGESIKSLARHKSTMVLFLSSALSESVRKSLTEGGYPPDTPAAVVYKATWNDEKIVRTTLEKLPEAMTEAGITKTALIIVGRVLDTDFERSRLYAPDFTTEFRKGNK